jgi:hypothetical protein
MRRVAQAQAGRLLRVLFIWDHCMPAHPDAKVLLPLIEEIGALIMRMSTSDRKRKWSAPTH